MSNCYNEIFVTPWSVDGRCWCAAGDGSFKGILRCCRSTPDDSVKGLRELFERVPMNGYIYEDARVTVVPPPLDYLEMYGEKTLDEHNFREYRYAGRTWYVGWSLQDERWFVYRYDPPFKEISRERHAMQPLREETASEGRPQEDPSAHP